MQRRTLVTLVITVVILAGVVALFTVGPKRIRYWRCPHAVERPTRHEAIDAYYEYCWTRAEVLHGPDDTELEGPEGAGWYRVQVYGIHKDGSPTSFLFVGRRTADSGWTVLSEATGP